MLTPIDFIKNFAYARNTSLDNFFYDTSKLNFIEKLMIQQSNINEGGVIVVSPTAHNEPLSFYRNIQEFKNSNDYEKIEAVSVSGVGSSGLGAAALARNVANAYSTKVAAVVSGYGVSDVVSEALGGWFFFGGTERLLHQVKNTARLFPSLKPEIVSEDAIAESAIKSAKFIPDEQTLYQLVENPPPKLKIFVGHSKGCLLLNFALNNSTHTKNIKNEKLPTVVTFGAVIDIPEIYKRVFQFVGDCDLLGQVNSIMVDKKTVLKNSSHWLNTQIPLAVNAEEVLTSYVKL
ncbi:MAG: hypothetical protein K2Y10_02610 [Burkholderiaceae bacterium]|nr:hypothetical protein [Burkholderiaceae bacterium]